MNESINKYVEEVKKVELINCITMSQMSNLYALKINQLKGFDIVVICDDSESMNLPLQAYIDNHFDINQSIKWNILKNAIKGFMMVNTMINEAGIDIHFLNGFTERNVCESSTIDTMFETKPRGCMFVENELEKILQYYMNGIADNKLLIIIASDTNLLNESKEFNKLFGLLLKNRRTKKMFLTFLSFQDGNEKCMDEWKILNNFYMCHNYYFEKSIDEESLTFLSYSDYIINIMLGAIDKDIRKKSNRKKTINKTKEISEYNQNCCVS